MSPASISASTSCSSRPGQHRLAPPADSPVQTAVGFLAAALALLSVGRCVRGFHLTELLAGLTAAIGVPP